MSPTVKHFKDMLGQLTAQHKHPTLARSGSSYTDTIELPTPLVKINIALGDKDGL